MQSRIRYEQELKKLDTYIIDMSERLTKAIAKTQENVMTKNEALSDEIINDDDTFDALERETEKFCIDLIIKEAPVASDIRRIASVMRIVGDLERIADHCSDIALYVKKLANEKPVEVPQKFTLMTDTMEEMVNDITPAFENLDISLARTIEQKDEIVDSLFDEIVEELSQNISNDPQNAKAYVDYLFIVKYVERMADHSVNVAQWIPYIASGEYVLNKNF